MESSESEKSTKVERNVEVFLKEMQSKHGEKSVIFVGLFASYWMNTSDIHGKLYGLRYLSISMGSFKRSLKRESPSYVLFFDIHL